MLFYPPYSLELKSIEQIWALVKGKVKHHKLEDAETLKDRVIDAANEVPIQHLQNIIQHSKVRFVKLFKILQNICEFIL
jgi:transposase